ncbi:MAG TPA: ComEC/Rec2 family competence protein [Chitinophagaceae bacterium]|nr:ComEC/Rec2 family competence protein [Chitinophagaceae bacterium]
MKRIAPWWNMFPFIRILIPLIAGIFYRPARLEIPVTATVCLLFFSLLVSYLPVYQQFRLRFIKGIWLNTLVFAGGFTITHLQDVRNSPNWFARHQYDALMVKTITEPKPGKSASYVHARVTHLSERGKWHSARGNIRIRLPGKSQPPFPGTMICISKKPKLVENSPGSNFNFRDYLANQNIYHQVDPSINELKIFRSKAPPAGMVALMRENILKVIDNNFRHAEERALAKALLVGYRDELDMTTVAAYTNTGVIHVIAISGLHLGLIYALLLILTSPLVKGRKSRIITNIAIGISLWVFTLICGATPSVVRSAVMFTSLLAGDTLGSENNTGNALASSAFLLLCFDPFLLRDIGFQLSYAAVASLLVYNRAISSIYLPENGILLHAWSSISTSIAAQILTTPLVLVHFHQFPLLFVMSNLVAVPVSGIILILLILLVIVQSLPLFPSLITNLSSWFIRLMNVQVSRIATIPFSTWKEISWSNRDLILSYLLILFITIFLRTKHPPAFIFFLLTILTWLIDRKYSS